MNKEQWLRQMQINGILGKLEEIKEELESMLVTPETLIEKTGWDSDESHKRLVAILFGAGK